MESGIATISDILRVEDWLMPNEHDICELRIEFIKLYNFQLWLRSISNSLMTKTISSNNVTF